MTEKPVFVRAMSRSGGTLMVTVLDNHPELAMTYEFYPNLLEGLSRIDARNVIDVLFSEKSINKAADAMPTPGTQKLIKRAPRARLDNFGLASLLKEHLDAGFDFESVTGRNRFMERCAVNNATIAKKKRWGMKCNQRINEYHQEWPKAKFINVIRDGRDVLASQLNTGSFNPDCAALGRSWASNHLKFRQRCQRDDFWGIEVSYEKLVLDPKTQLKKLCEFLEIEFDDNILDFYRSDLNIYKVGHMSMPNLVNPINDSAIGRWRNELSRYQIREFELAAKEALIEFGYV